MQNSSLRLAYFVTNSLYHQNLRKKWINVLYGIDGYMKFAQMRTDGLTN